MNNIQEHEKSGSRMRRVIIKSVAMSIWAPPLVETAILPAHAITSITECQTLTIRPWVLECRRPVIHEVFNYFVDDISSECPTLQLASGVWPEPIFVVTVQPSFGADAKFLGIGIGENAFVFHYLTNCVASPTSPDLGNIPFDGYGQFQSLSGKLWSATYSIRGNPTEGYVVSPIILEPV